MAKQKKDTKIKKVKKRGTIKEKKIANQKALLVKALQENLFNISAACKSVRVSRWTFYDYQEKDILFAEKVAEAKEEQIDFVESKLLSNVRAGKEASIIFYLKTIGRKRGYQETLQVSPEAQEHQEAIRELEALGLDKVIEMTIRERQVVQIKGGL